ncbi:MAG: ATP-binding protein [Capsulimonas sp.]|uniref:sensor histidine kinase n=1 Tax=Capsulimonas sp. TaxID=2494211 RepID=UPI003263740F
MNNRHLVGRLTSFGLAAVLLTLASFAVWTAVTTQRLASHARAAVEISDVYQQARYAVGEEETGEHRYFMQPSPEAREQYRQTVQELTEYLSAAAHMDGVHDPTLAPMLLKLHEQYLKASSEMFDAVDAHRMDRAHAIDAARADPAFSRIEMLVNREAGEHHVEALQAIKDLDRTQHRSVWLTLMIFTVGLALLALCFRILKELGMSALRQTQASLSDAERQLVHSSKLASLGTLSAGIAHELNQPIAIIRGVSQQLQDEPGLSEDVQSDLTLIEGQTSRMVKIINHLRSFSRTGTHTFEEVSVNSVIQECLLLIGAQLRTHDVELQLELGEVPEVLADANELEQVFLNLITNARDAMEGRRDARIVVRTYLRGEWVVMEFRDNGAGIPSEVAERIFDPFFTTKDVGKGTGLGLSISHGIIDKHHGTLGVHNDDGAVFTITLPMSSQESAAPPMQFKDAA